MGAEVGATSSLFPYDRSMEAYLQATGRAQVAALASAAAVDLRADEEIAVRPEAYYDQLLEIDLSALEPRVNGPFTPEASFPVSRRKDRIAGQG